VIGAAVAGEAILVLKQPHPKPYEPQSEHNRIRRRLAARPPEKG